MATKKEKDKEILMKTKKPGLPVNIKKPSIPQSSNAMGASGTILNNVNVRPTRAQTAMHDVKTFHKEYISGTKDLLKSKNILEKAKGLAAGSIGGIMQEGMPLAMSTPALFNVISGQARYNKNKRAGFGRNFGVPNVAENRERSKGLSKSDSILAVQGKLPAVTSGRDTPLPSSDGILKNAANKVLDFIKR